MLNVKNEGIDLSFVLDAVRKRIKFVVILVALSVLIATITSFSMKQIFRSTSLIQLPVVTDYKPNGISFKRSIFHPRDVEQFIKQFDTYCKNEEKGTLAEKLGIPKEKASMILSIEPEAKKDGENYQIKVVLETKDPSIIPNIEENIILALNNNEIYRKEMANVMESLTHQKKVIQDLIRDAEIIQSLAREGIRKGTITSWGFDPIAAGDHLIGYYLANRELSDKLKNLNFSYCMKSDPYPAGIRTKQRIVFAGMASLIAGILIALALERFAKSKDEIDH